MLHIILIVVLAIPALVLYLIRHRYNYWRRLGVPYAKDIAVPYGNLKSVGKVHHLKDLMAKYYFENKNKTPVFGCFFFHRPVAVFTDLDVIKRVLIKDAACFNDRGQYYNEKDDPISSHLFSMHGEKWKLLRTKLTPTFTSGKMKYMFPIVVQIGRCLEEKVASEIATDADIEIKDIFARYTTDVIGNCAFGIECQSLNGLNDDFREVGIKVFEKPKFSFFVKLLLMSGRPWAQRLGICHVHKEISEFLTKVINDAAKHRLENNVERKDFLNILLELRKSLADTDNPLTMNEITAQAFLFFAAGFETSSTLLTFTFYILSTHPDIQEKARAHIEEVIERHRGELTYEAMMEMKYLDQILFETLRMFSPISTLTRVTENEYHIPDSNITLDKGTFVTIPIHGIHYDPELYPNPDVFNPENFAEENVQSRHNMSFLPFGDGPRNCIGDRFGMMQARIGLIHALRNFQYSKSEKMTYPVDVSKKHFITSPVGGMFVKVQPLK